MFNPILFSRIKPRVYKLDTTQGQTTKVSVFSDRRMILLKNPRPREKQSERRGFSLARTNGETR